MRLLGALAGCAVALAAPVGGLVAPQRHDHKGRGPAAPAATICTQSPADLAVIPGTVADADPPYLRIIDRPRTRELVIEVGPVDLPAHAMADHSRELAYQLTYLPFDAWVHGYRVELLDAAGHTLPRALLHHIDTTRPAFRELFLPVPARFLAAGLDTKSQDLPAWLIGARIYRNEPLLVSTMLHNPTHRRYAGVRVRLVLPYTRSRPLLEVGGFYMDVKFPVGPKQFDLPPGRSVWTWEGSPAIPATLIGVTGHLHRYAEWLELRDVTSGKMIWRAYPDRDRTGAMTTMPVHFLQLGFGYRLEPGHRYRITALYDNTSGRAIPEGGMAKFAGVVIPASGVPWPRVDAADPLYRQDVGWMLAEPCAASPARPAEYALHLH